MDQELKKRIEKQINGNHILLYMKGSPEKPMCGFSAGLVAILRKNETPFETYDVLSDSEIRNGIKEYTDWPTIPQLYVNGKFIGGHDIIVEMDKSGELKNTLQTSAS